MDSKDCGLVDVVQSGWFQNESGELFKGFPITNHDRVVDVGCGLGSATLFCAKQGAQVIFTDTESSKVEALSQRLDSMSLHRYQGIVSDSNPLPIPDAYATRVIALEVLEHVDEPMSVMQELFRIGKPGALYLLAVPDAAGEKIQKLIAPTVHFERPNHIHIFERAQFEALVSNSGLVIDKKDTYSFYWCMWMLIYWASLQATGESVAGATHDTINPPYPPLLNEWATLWYQLISMPHGPVIRRELDKLLPKSQVIIARKPMANSEPMNTFSPE